MSKAVLFFADGTEECEALLVADLLRRAKVEVIIASAMGRRALVSSHGIHLNADALAEDRKSTRLNSSHSDRSRMPSSA